MISKSSVNSGRLCTLVFSLTKSERRYISVVLKTHKENNKYKDVIDAITKDIDLYEVFKNENVGVLKNDSYYFILRCLRGFNANKSVKQKLNNFLSIIEVLANKSMYKEAYKELEKALTLSRKYSEESYTIKLISWKRFITNANIKIEFNDKNIEESFLEMNNALDTIDSINQYWRLSNRVFVEYKKYYIKKDAVAFKNLNNLLEDFLLENCDNCSPKAKLVYYNLVTIKYQINNQFKELLQSTTDAILLIEDNEALFNENKSLYFNSLFNNIVIAIELQDYKIATKNILKFIEVKPPLRKKFTDKDNVYLFKSHLFLNLKLLNAQGRFEEAISFALEKLGTFKKLKGSIDDLSIWKFKYQVALSYFYSKDYQEALNWINKIINSENVNWKKESFNISLLYNILLYELSFDSLLVSNIRSFKRIIKLSKKEENYFKDSLLDLLTYLSSKSIKNIEPNRMLELLHSFRQDSKTISNDNAFLIFWLKSKAYKKDLSEIAKENSIFFSMS